MQIENNTEEPVTYEAKDGDTEDDDRRDVCREPILRHVKKNVTCTEGRPNWTVRIFRRGRSSHSGELTGVDGDTGDLVFEGDGNGHRLRHRH